jgi:mevalonate kinase
MPVVGKGFTKLILFGEHAAVYGHPAVGIALPWTVTASIAPANFTHWNISNLDSKHAVKLDALLQRLPTVFPDLLQMPPIEISVNAQAPIGIGFGSSGALCVALTRCLFSYLKMDKIYKSNEEKLFAVWKYSHELEKIFHQTPSGVDTAISAFGKLCSFGGNVDGLPICEPIKDIDIPLVLGALPRETDTGSLVSDLRIRKEQNNQIEHLFKSLGDIASEAIDILKNPQPKFALELGRLATEAQQYLSALHLSTNALDDILKAGLAYGAIGGKLSGAGGGGAYYFIAESEEHAESIAQNLKDYIVRNEILHLVPPLAIHTSSQ